MTPTEIGDQGLYKGYLVTITDDIKFLPLRREIEWTDENGMRRFKWVMLYELSEIAEDES